MSLSMEICLRHLKDISCRLGYLTMRSLQSDRSVVIKPAEKGSAVVAWDRNDYLKQTERQLIDEKNSGRN